MPFARSIRPAALVAQRTGWIARSRPVFSWDGPGNPRGGRSASKSWWFHEVSPSGTPAIPTGDRGLAEPISSPFPSEFHPADAGPPTAHPR